MRTAFTSSKFCWGGPRRRRGAITVPTLVRLVSDTGQLAMLTDLALLDGLVTVGHLFLTVKRGFIIT